VDVERRNMPTPTVDISNLTPEQIQSAIAKLSPDRLQALRQAAAQAGLPTENDELRRLPNGSIQILVTVPVDYVPALVEFAQGANEPLHDYIEKILLMGIDGFFLGGPQEEEPAVTPTTTIPIGTQSGTTTAVPTAEVTTAAK
jgi:hypothetical protein